VEFKKIYKHYDEEAKKYFSSPKSTMPDLFIRKKEIEKIIEVLNSVVDKAERILEIGCGNGYTITKLAKNFECDFVGTDSNKSMIRIAKKRKKIKNLEFKINDVLNLKIPKESFDIVFTERCLINLIKWNNQMKALHNIHRVLRKDGKYIMLEGFNDGYSELNKARKVLGMEKIKPAWHNQHFSKSKFEKFIKPLFYDFFNKSSKIQYDNFLSSYYFGSRVLYPSLVENKKKIVYNNKFVEYFSYVPSVGNYSPIQLCVLEKI